MHDTAARTLTALTATGAELVHVAHDVALITAAVHPDALGAIAAHPSVTYASEILTPATSRGDVAVATSSVATQSAAGDSDGTGSATCPTGILTEGDAQLNADDARAARSVDGAGVRVGVLSDTYNALSGEATDIVDAELPGAANPCGNTTPVVVQADQVSGSDEGRAMAQIVHDLAPGAEIAFATAFNGEADFAQQVRDLAANGSDVIVDDITYFAEPMYQDGLIAKAMADVIADGVPVFSSAGNQHTTLSGDPIGSYETPAYRPVACPTGVPAYNDSCHDFDPSAGTTAHNTITLNNNGRLSVILGYNQPQFGITADFDLYLINDANNAVLASSENDNVASGRAYEFVDYTNSSGSAQTLRLVVGRYNGAAAETPRMKLMHYRASGVSGMAFKISTGGDVFGPTLHGHHAQADVVAVAATPWFDANAIESYSSRGPAHTCWGPVVGTTPAAPITPCTEATVNMTATDGGKNSFFGSLSGGTWRFYGTSAAAPHAAAVAALLYEAAPCRTQAEIVAAMEAGAVALGGYGVHDQGTGRIDALGALAQLAPCIVAPTVSSVSPSAGVTTGGTNVAITGEGFTGATSVRFGSTQATSFEVLDDTSIAAVTPSRPEGLVNVWVTNPAGTSSSSPASWFNYQAPPSDAPTVSSITPNIGTVDGGTEVTIKGTGFLTASQVRFGPSDQASFTVVNDSTIVAVSPPRVESLVNVWVTNPNGTSSSGPPSWFSYRVITGPPPTVASITPKNGPTTGGQEVTIVGTGFTDVNQVRFGNTDATSFVVVNDTTITAVTPVRLAGWVNVWVISQNGKNGSSLTSFYRFDAP